MFWSLLLLRCPQGSCHLFSLAASIPFLSWSCKISFAFLFFFFFFNCCMLVSVNVLVDLFSSSRDIFLSCLGFFFFSYFFFFFFIELGFFVGYSGFLLLFIFSVYFVSLIRSHLFSPPIIFFIGFFERNLRYIIGDLGRVVDSVLFIVSFYYFLHCIF